jgi:5'-methylthioadenosine/S-adenosylhomocysteine nucleosidase
MAKIRPVAVIIAMPKELESVLDACGSAITVEYKNKTFYLAELEEQPIVLALSGVGKVNAAYTATLLIERFEPGFLITTGAAGGFGLDLFDVFIAEKVVQHDIDTTACGDPKGLISGLNEIYIEADQNFVKNCLKYIPNAKKGILASGDQFIASHEKAQSIISQFGASACDMESGAIGQVAKLAGVPFGVIRTITDNGNVHAGTSFYATLENAMRINRDAIKAIINKQ